MHHNFDFLGGNALEFAVYGFVAVLIRTAVLLDSATAILSWASLGEAFVVGAVGSLAGILMSGLVKYVRRWWGKK